MPGGKASHPVLLSHRLLMQGPVYPVGSVSAWFCSPSSWITRPLDGDHMISSKLHPTSMNRLIERVHKSEAVIAITNPNTRAKG